MRIVKLTSIKITDVNNPRVKNIEPTAIDKKYLKGLKFHYVDTIDQVLEKALLNQKVSNYKKL